MMRTNNCITKILGLGLTALFISSAVGQTVLSHETLQKDETIFHHQSSNKKISTTPLANIQCYAVIAACSQYEDKTHNIPKIFPYSDAKLKVFYDTLIQSRNWNHSHIILLVNENATKQNITAALDHMAAMVGPNDLFLFSWCGHGTEVSDTDGDESNYDLNDTTDEAICPYDIAEINHSWSNVITDDELNRYFSNITCQGMILIFDCCFSGGMVDRNSMNSMIHDQNDFKASIAFGHDFAEEIENPQSSDVDGHNRVVIMSTLPDLVERSILLTGFPLATGMAFACSHVQYSDKNKDGYVSAEEAFNIARPLVFVQSSMLWFGLWTYDYLLAILKMVPGAFFYSLFEILFSYFLIQKIIQVKYDHSMGNIPMIQDGYPGELPLIEI
jgi:hypothetical protein